MAENSAQFRSRAAQAARAYLRKELSWEHFIEEFGEVEDELIGVVVDLIEHEPKRGGILGINEKEWAAFQSELSEAIRALEA